MTALGTLATIYSKVSIRPKGDGEIIKSQEESFSKMGLMTFGIPSVTSE